mmetsp:Transcript_1298/g.1960  ORF Transcript_1298/g.1960 Transcript_1298/m.1960 type:complete len:448 (+) Transcript_1298:568-1911(+)|eukprot:CAMPEP_0184653470 /NCGR_PEP_ID=MMETSP0308-20130426/11190_1 /TAXON_ID=38269 /ORGANISM="Gloeochaete witrockiana, Strain SAG 46.84" /LENGTH=447 /DNA_ID=CAMNT_0027088947 /DNA_START=566 /DNA_END=1909 /DNA_ORIENTATION=-
MQMIANRFKASISRGVGRTDSVLLGFSGGTASCCLMHLVAAAVGPEARRRMIFPVTVVHIDEGVVFQQCLAGSYENTLGVLREMVVLSGLPLKVVQIEDVYLPAGVPIFPKDGTESNSGDRLDRQRKVQLLFSSASSPTAREDLLESLRLQLLLRVAEEGKFTKLVLGDSATRVAVRIISGTCKGRGYAVPTYVLPIDWRSYSDFNIGIVRPLCDVLAKECALYNSFHRIPTLQNTALDTLASSHLWSIDHLTEALIAKLQVDYPFTVHNITRTSQKLTVEGAVSRATSRSDVSASLHVSGRNTPISSSSSSFASIPPFLCPLCSSPLSPADLDNVIKVKGKESSNCNFETCSEGFTPGPNANEASCCSNAPGQCGSSWQYEKRTLQFLTCYGCRRVLSDMKIADVNGQEDILPSFVTSRALELEASARQEKLRNTIKEFLLDDEDD